MLTDPVEIYKMADWCQPEVARDVISGQNVGIVHDNSVMKFEGPNSDCLRVFQFAQLLRQLQQRVFQYTYLKPMWHR